MSFNSYKYESDLGIVLLVRMTPERFAAAGDEPTADAIEAYVKTSKGSREFGVKPRGVKIYREVGTAPNTFKKYSFLPVLTATSYGSDDYAKDATLVIDGVTWTVVSRKDEDY